MGLDNQVMYDTMIHIPRSEVYSIMKHMKFMLHRIMQMISNNDKSRYFGVQSFTSLKENLSQVINGGFAFILDVLMDTS